MITTAQPQYAICPPEKSSTWMNNRHSWTYPVTRNGKKIGTLQLGQTYESETGTRWILVNVDETYGYVTLVRLTGVRTDMNSHTTWFVSSLFTPGMAGMVKVS